MEVVCGTNPYDNNDYPIDTDGDGYCDAIDPDDDNDGVLDIDDDDPLVAQFGDLGNGRLAQETW